MAFVRTSMVNGRRYIQVADYYYDPTGNRKVKIIKSFGMETPQSRMEAEAFLANFHAFEKLKDQNKDKGWDELLKLGKCRPLYAENFVIFRMLCSN